MLPEAKGFINVGSICYWNSLLQALASCTSLTNELKRQSHSLLLEALVGSDTKVHIELHSRVMQYLLKKKHIDVPLRGQQCAGEAFTLLLTALEDNQLIQNLFLFKYLKYIECKACGMKTDPIEEKNNLMILPDSRNIADISRYLLYHTQDIEYRCSKCQSSNAVQHNRLVLIPEILVMMFRKEYESDAFYTNMPDTLEIRQFKYRPVAFIQHFGGPSGGHYNCIALRKQGFFVLDDQNVSEIESQRHFNKTTYIVVYHLI
jgi:ubiquitin C-terminal hydrolase